MNPLILIEGAIAHVLQNGSAFVHSNNGQEIYVPSKLIEHLRVDAGDTLRCWCTLNDPDHAHTAQYRAVRVRVSARLEPLEDIETGPETSGEAPARPFDGEGDIPLPKTMVAPLGRSPEAAGAVKTSVLEGDALTAMIGSVLNLPRLFTAKDIYMEICRRDPTQWADDRLQAKIISACVVMAERGDMATARLFSRGDQSNASAVYYGRNLDLLTMFMKGEQR